MEYIPLLSFNLKTDWSAKDITITNYNQTFSRIKAYMEALNNNIQYVHENAITSIPVTTDEEPADYEGNIYFKLED